jgi:hypothetical protein
MTKIDTPEVSIRLLSSGLYLARYRPAGSAHVVRSLAGTLQSATDWLTLVMRTW